MVIDNRYEIVRFLGGGGMGNVYLCRETDLKREVAVKILHESQALDADGVARFEREGQIISNLTHRNIPVFYRFSVWEQRCRYIAMEYVVGPSLREELDREEKLAWRRCLGIAVQVCDALSHAHEHGVVHRDIKPHNIVLLSEPEPDLVKLIDFGLARLLAPQSEGERLTQTGMLVGSVNYMSPEQCLGGKADARSDIYALGCVMYECLAGEPPLVADNPVAMLHKHVNEVPQPLTKIIHTNQLPVGLEAAIFKAMAKQPDNRYQSADDLKRDLELILSGQGQDVAADLRVVKSFSWRLPFALGAGLAVAVVVGCWLNETIVAGVCKHILKITDGNGKRAQIRMATWLESVGKVGAADQMLAPLAPAVRENMPLAIFQRENDALPPTQWRKALVSLEAYAIRARLKLKSDPEESIALTTKALRNVAMLFKFQLTKEQFAELDRYLLHLMPTLKTQVSASTLSGSFGEAIKACTARMVSLKGGTSAVQLSQLIINSTGRRSDGLTALMMIYSANCSASRDRRMSEFFYNEAYDILADPTRTTHEQLIEGAKEAFRLALMSNQFDIARRFKRLEMLNISPGTYQRMTNLMDLANLEIIAENPQAAEAMIRDALDKSTIDYMALRGEAWKILFRALAAQNAQAKMDAAIAQFDKELDELNQRWFGPGAAGKNFSRQPDRQVIGQARISLMNCLLIADRRLLLPAQLVKLRKDLNDPDSKNPVTINGLCLKAQGLAEAGKLDEAQAALVELDKLTKDRKANFLAESARFHVALKRNNLKEAQAVMERLNQSLGPGALIYELEFAYGTGNYQKVREVAARIRDERDPVLNSVEIEHTRDVLINVEKMEKLEVQPASHQG